MRLSVNTLFGLGGLLDIGTEAGIDRHSEDFGQTLGRWGVPSGPVPGAAAARPVDLRDTSALMPLDFQGDPVNAACQTSPCATRCTHFALVDIRANLPARQPADRAMPHSTSIPFTRDAFLQRRRNEIARRQPAGRRHRWSQRSCAIAFGCSGPHPDVEPCRAGCLPIRAQA